MESHDEKYMKMALELAQRGIGAVEPNPAVGCVIVKDNQVAGKGFHKKFGAPHAEINALANCKKLGIDPAGATMYVTLEPCSHQGKTPPCTDAIIEAKIARVVVAAVDPSKHASGAGLEKLRNAGIEVLTGICQTEANLLNAPFMKFAASGKTWVTLKWAQSIDGKLAFTNPTDDQRWISNELSRKDAHNLRRRADAILVGINTVLADDPLLTPRPAKGRKPTRIVLDSHLRIPLNSQLLSTAKKAPVLIYTSEQAANTNPEIVQKITQTGAEVLSCPDTGRSNLHFLLEKLSKRGIAHLLVEGGPKTITSFLEEDLADEVVIYIAPKTLGHRGCAPISESMARLARASDLCYTDVKKLGDDVRISALTAVNPPL